MGQQIKGLYLGKRGVFLVDVFGRTSNGLPGLEIIGLGRVGKNLKEKFLYLTKARGINIPVKKYILCLESFDVSEKDLIAESENWIEFPLLLLFWSLAQQIQVHNLGHCFTAGCVHATGKIQLLKMPLQMIEKVYAEGRACGADNLTLIGPRENRNDSYHLRTISHQELLGHIPNLYFQTSGCHHFTKALA